jgi:hypothetical protein
VWYSYSSNPSSRSRAELRRRRRACVRVGLATRTSSGGFLYYPWHAGRRVGRPNTEKLACDESVHVVHILCLGFPRPVGCAQQLIQTNARGVQKQLAFGGVGLSHRVTMDGSMTLQSSQLLGRSPVSAVHRAQVTQHRVDGVWSSNGADFSQTQFTDTQYGGDSEL